MEADPPGSPFRHLLLHVGEDDAICDCCKQAEPAAAGEVLSAKLSEAAEQNTLQSRRVELQAAVLTPELLSQV